MLLSIFNIATSETAIDNLQGKQQQKYPPPGSKQNG